MYYFLAIERCLKASEAITTAALAALSAFLKSLAYGM